MWNPRRFWPMAIAVGVCGLTWGLLWRARGVADARAVYIALSEQRYAYEAAKSVEADALRRAAAGERAAAARLYAAAGMLASVERELRAAAYRSDERLVLLASILRTLTIEQAALNGALQAIEQGVPVQVAPGQRLDVWLNAMQELRENWGLRQKLWRGQPLTA